MKTIEAEITGAAPGDSATDEPAKHADKLRAEIRRILALVRAAQACLEPVDLCLLSSGATALSTARTAISAARVNLDRAINDMLCQEGA